MVSGGGVGAGGRSGNRNRLFRVVSDDGGGGGVAAVGTETVGGGGVNVSLLTLSCEAGLHEVLTVDLLCVCVLSA